MSYNEFADKFGTRKSDATRIAESIVNDMKSEGRTELNLKDYAKATGSGLWYGIKDVAKSGYNYINGRLLGTPDLALGLTGNYDKSPAKMARDLEDEYGTTARVFNNTLNLLGSARTMQQGGQKLLEAGAFDKLANGGKVARGVGKLTKFALIDKPSNAVSSSLGSGLALGVVNPQTWYGNLLTGLAGGVAGGAVGAGGRAIKNTFDIKNGGKKIIGQLDGVLQNEPVQYGTMTDARVGQINDAIGSERLSGGSVTVPSPKHLLEQRVEKNGLTSDEVVDLLNSTIHGKDAKVTKAREPRQAIIKPRENSSAVTIIEPKDDGSGVNVITTGIRNNRGLKNSSLVERQTSTLPQSENELSASLAGSKGTSGLQGARDIIQQNEYNVNKNKFINSLSDQDNTETMIKGVKSGDKITRENATTLIKDIDDMRSGKPNEDLRRDLTTEEMYKVQDDYARFDASNGRKTVPQQSINKFYKNNPMAMNVLEEIKKNAPYKLKGYKDNSFHTLNQVKKDLHAGSKWQMNSTTARDGYRHAEQELKTILDSNFNGHRALDTRYAIAERAQEAFEDAVYKNAKKIAGTNPTKWYNGAVIPSLLGSFTPYGAPIAGASILANIAKRAIQRNAGRSVSNGTLPLTEVVSNSLKDAGKYGVKFSKTPTLSELIFQLENKGE